MRNRILKRVITVIFLLLHTLEIFGANLVVDPNSTYNTKIDESRNGVPIVNISTPNDRGVSINEFKEYNVDEKGQILNNADNIGRSYLGGLINANPNLAPNQAANLIILQVNGSNRSQIEGYLEALSRQKVDVILANENGLYINNSGTINIKNFTATTGKLNLKDGDFVGIDVEKGNVLIGPKGFNGNNTDYVDIIAKTLELRGNIVANNLNIKTGSNDKNSSNILAIDASELGGMYAGVIKIVSTDKGVGVNSDSFIVSKDKKLEITADGQIKINKVQAKGVDIKGKEYVQKDLTYSDGDISIKADKIKLAGTGMSGNKVSLNGDVENSSDISVKENLNTKNFSNTGLVQVNDKIEVLGNVNNTGEILTNNSFTAKDVKTIGKLISKDNINVSNLENSGVITSNNKLNIDGKLNNAGEIQITDNIVVNGNVENIGEILTNGSFTSKDIKNKKELSANKDIRVSKLENTGNVLTNSKISINGDLTNTGELKALDSISVTENTTNDGSILTNKNFSTSDLTNNKKIIVKEKIDTKNLKNTGTIASGDKFTINGNFENNNNIETAALDLTGNKLTNSGSIKADNISANVTNITNSGKILSSNNIVFSNAQKLQNTNDILAIKNIQANNTIIENDGKIASNNKIMLNNSSIKNTKKITSDTIEMKNNRSFDNTGEIIGNNVVLTSENNLDFYGKVQGNQNLSIIGKNIENNGEIIGTGSANITSTNFTNNGELTAQVLTVDAKNGKLTNNNIISGEEVTLSAKNIENNDLISSAKNITLKADEKILNNSNKTIYTSGKLSISGKEIENKKNAEFLATDIELKADKVKNEVGTIKASNNIIIKADKFENIGEVKDLDRYESYYETWDGKVLTESEIGNWKRIGGDYSKNKRKRANKAHVGDYIRRKQKDAYEEITKKVEEDKYKSLLFPKYTKYMRGYLGNRGTFTEKTGSARIKDIPLKEKLRSLSETEYAKVIAGNNIIIEGKDGGKSRETLNKDAIISAGNTVKIDTNKLENIVSIGDEKIKVKTGQESMEIKFERTGHRLNKHVQMNVTYRRDFTNDYITKKVPVLDEHGNPVLNFRGRPKYEYVKEYVGRYSYVTGSPSIIEGKNVIIDRANLVVNGIEEANGKINQGISKNNVVLDKKKISVGTREDISNSVSNPIKGNIEISTNSRVFEDILRNGVINIDVTTPSALFIKNVNPDSKYLLETRVKYINQKEFYGSDYFLKRIGYEDKWTRVRRLGDAYYENQLIERNIIEKLGTRFINGKELSIKELIDNGTDIAKKNALTIGQGLTKEQIAKLDKDIVWYEYQNVDGIQVLAPKVYLSQNTLKNLNSDSRTKIVGLDNTYIKTNKLENTALISGRGNTFIEADEVNNRTLGNQLAEISGENTQIIATNNINNIGARISAKQNLNLIAVNGDILNKSTVEKVEFNNGEFDRSKFTKIASVGEIISDGNLNIIANNYTSEGAVTQAKNVNINVTNDVNISSQKVSGEQKFGKNDGQYNYYGFERNLGSVVKTENLNVTAKNVNISGSVVTTQTADLNVDKLNIESKVDKEDEIKKSSYKSFLKSGSKKEIIHNEENSAGSLYVENKGTIKGDVNLVGSNLVLGDNSIINGKLTTDSNELHSSYSLEEKKKGFSSSIGSGGFSVGYGKSQSKLKEKDLTNAKSNLVLGDNVTLNKGAEITATNFTHGKVTVNNGDVKFGARKDTRDVETSSKSSGVNLSVRIKSEALDRAKQGVDSVNQLKSGDILGGLASTTNTVTGLVQGLSSNITKKDGSKATLKDIKDGDFKVNNNFYANAGVNLGFNKSSSKSNSHSESAVVTTIRGKDENSSITYNNVKNVEYVGTQAKDTKFIYNNVENINKTAVELNNSYSSTGKSSGISAGATINYNNGFQAEANAVSISASQSKMNSNGTTYQNGRFVNVDEVHNNTKNMTLSGFNQEGGTVTGNIENLTIESKQNTSTTKGSTKGGSLSVSANGLPSGSANYSKTNGERKVVDNASTFIIGDGSNLKVGKLENTASAIGTTENGKLSIDEYVGHNLENVDKLKTAGGSVGVSTSGITSIGVNYSDKKQEGITKNTVIGNVEIGKSSGDEINRDLDTMTEITEDRDFKTNINVESQTISYIKNPEKFKEDLQIAIIEGKATGRTVVKTIDNVINGDKSQDIGDAERRSLIEIKEAIVRVQTAPAMDIIAEKDLADKNIQARLGVEIEKFDPNDPTLSEKVRERIDELKAEGKELVAFYDKVTKKIFINQNAKDEEVRASIAREYKIKEDLELGRGKENDKGQLRSTVAGEIAYDEIKDRLKKGDKNPISASSFDVAKMDKDSEVTADNYRFEDRKLRKEYKEIVYFTDERKEQMSEGGLDMMAGGGTALAGGAVIGASIGVDYVSFGTTIVPSTAAKAGGATAVVVGGNRFITGGLKFLNGLYGSGKKETLNPIRDSIPKKYQGYYDAFEVTVEVGILHLAPHAQPYYSQPNKSVINISQQQRELNKQMNLNASVGQQKVPISSTRSSTDGKNYNAIKEISQGKVFINNEKTGETTMAYQKRITYSNGSMRIFQENLTTGEISLQKINPLGQRVFEKTLTPYKSNTLIEASSSSKMLVGDRAVSQVASKVGQVQNNRLPYKPVLALPVKYPIVTKSGVTLYQDYAIGSRGAKYIEVGVSNNKEIVYKNNSGSYFKLTDKGLENISSKDVIKKEYFPTVKVQKNNGSNPSAGKNYYVSKEGNFKVEKYIEAGQTVEDYDKIYLIENVRARGINVGRSKEHTNTTISHWEKAVDIADEAKVDPNVKAVYVDETLKNISDKFKDSDARPDVTIEYKDGTFKLIEVQSKTDYRPKLENKLKNLQTKYGEDVITNYKVEKPKGGK
ncbi:hemagglutinin repeat-containing protein [Fusobacterium periodonticum]|uniref:Filamentous hemagglutinin N-terminal domain-containing protein n=2 Tax=Fusobacterium periodonticum TaxID=860 RepID=A0AAD0MSL6_9FUSO|nr:hemagglutinin repeat-containing protein [Fusobacterium periodonticum]AVQ26374.1 filamentous hemagglutinin N-terminal domain-containing protein [Fusobacterium periodonticum]KGE62456.1 filamentous hemagglutinin [Fusobacterium periodonticum 2_1_31]